MDNAALLIYLGHHIQARNIRWDSALIKIESLDMLERDIRTKKADMQNYISAGRMDIFIVTDANEPDIMTLIKSVGETAREIFTEDFIVVKVNLLIFITEANEPIEDYAIRANTTYNLLVDLTAPYAFDIIFLLSDRNELGVVNAGNHIKACNGISALPSVLKKSDFYENMMQAAAARGRVLFASLGFGEVDCKIHEEYVPDRALALNLAEILENAISTPNEEHFIDISIPISEHEMQRAIAANVANPISVHSLIGTNLAQVEEMLFEHRAFAFYKENFYITPSVYNPSTILLSSLPARLKTLSGTIAILLECINIERRALEEKVNKPLRFSLYKGIDNAKCEIGSHYYKKFSIEYLEKKLAYLNTEKEEISSFLDSVTMTIDALKEIPPVSKIDLLPQAEKNAALNISLMRNDGLIFEEVTLGMPEFPSVLRIVGGFVPEDLTRFNAMAKHKILQEIF